MQSESVVEFKTNAKLLQSETGPCRGEHSLASQIQSTNNTIEELGPRILTMPLTSALTGYRFT